MERGATRQSPRAKSGASRAEPLARGGASREPLGPAQGKTRPGHVGDGVAGVRLAMWRSGGAEHVTGQSDLMWDTLGC